MMCFGWAQDPPTPYRFVECVHEWMNVLMLHGHRYLNSISAVVSLNAYTQFLEKIRREREHDQEAGYPLPTCSKC